MRRLAVCVLHLGLTPLARRPPPSRRSRRETVDDLLTRGKALMAQKKYAEALPLFERATQLAPGRSTLGCHQSRLRRIVDAMRRR